MRPVLGQMTRQQSRSPLGL
uniref:Uncharacterized protein n=1 Tax=Rhizophora mucronata TaxID=61149 RepID=A0A2P2QZ17_RHIMU